MTLCLWKTQTKSRLHSRFCYSEMKHWASELFSELKVQASKPKLQKTDAENVQWWHDWSFPDEHYGFPMLPLHSWMFCTVAWSIHLLQQNERKYSQMSTLQASIPTKVLITLSQSWCCLLKAFKLYKEQDKRFSHFSKKKKILSIFCVNNFCCFSEQRLKKHSIS